MLRWGMLNCRACNSQYAKGVKKCSVCDCPTNLIFWHYKYWDADKKRMKPWMPSNGASPLIPAAKCPCCNRIMYVGDCECPHCAHELTSEEIAVQKKYSRKQLVKGCKLGAIFTIGITIVFTIMFSI